MNIEIIRGSPGIDRSSFSLPLTRDDLDFHFISLEHLYLVVGIFLVGRLNHLILALQIYPKLEAERILLV